MPLFTSYLLRIVYEKDNERPAPRVMVQTVGSEEWVTFGDLADLAAYLEAEARTHVLTHQTQEGTHA